MLGHYTKSPFCTAKLRTFGGSTKFFDRFFLLNFVVDAIYLILRLGCGTRGTFGVEISQATVDAEAATAAEAINFVAVSVGHF